jgi:FAD/FMN-containing dehydrogenase
MLDPLFAKLTSDMPGASVETAAATLAGGGVVNLDLPRKSATDPTSSIFPAGQLVRSVLPLVVELSGQELQELARALAEVDPADTLFPDELFD